MRKVLRNHAEVAHIWAQQKQDEGRCGTLFFEGKSIFSYGLHFEIARFVRPDVVLFNSRSYSNSTSKHTRYVYRAVIHYTTFEVPSFDDHNYNVVWMLGEIELKDKQIRKSRTQARWAISDLQRLGNILGRYLDTFNQLGKTKIRAKLRKESEKILAEIARSNVTYADILKRQDEAKKRYEANWQVREAAKEKRRLELRAEQDKKDAENLEKWKAGENIYGYISTYYQGCFLRIKDNEIQTSQGANVPLPRALEIYDMLKAGKPVHGLEIGNYTITSFDGKTLIAGCHHISVGEMDRVVSTMLVKKEVIA